MESMYMSLEEMVSQLENEAQLYDNQTATEYLSSLQQYLDTVTVTFVYSKDTPNYNTDAGLAWVVVVPIIFFSSVALVMALLLVFSRHSENLKIESRSGEQADMADNALRSSSQAYVENTHDQERAVVIDCHGNSATSKGGAFLRGYVNAAGELEGASRASGASKGSVRSLGVLTDLNDKLDRPRIGGLHLNPPSAPSTLTRHGLTTFEMLARRRLSRSIDELRELKEGGRHDAVAPTEWSSLGAIGGRTSLEMNVTSETPQLTLLGSDLTMQDLPPSKRFSNSIDSLNENASRDSLRTSMEFHRSKGSSTGLGPGDLYGHSKRNSGSMTGDTKFLNGNLKRGYSVSSSSLDTASRSGSRFGHINLSFVKSDSGSANSQTGSNTYIEILNFNKPHVSKSDENINYVNCDVKKPQERGFDNHLSTHSTQQAIPNGDVEVAYDNIDDINKRKDPNERHTAITRTNTVGSNTADIITVGRGSIWLRGQEDNYPARMFPSKRMMESPPSSSDVASSSYRSRSPLQRGRPLSLDMLSSWSEDVENQGMKARGYTSRKPVTRRLFATTPQMSKKRVEDYSLFIDSSSKSAPSRNAIKSPFNLKSFVPYNVQGVEKHATNHIDYSSSNSNTQESSVDRQETAVPIAISKALLKPQINMKMPHSPTLYPSHETKPRKIHSQANVRKYTEFGVNDNPQHRHANFHKDQKYHGTQKSSLTQLGDAYLTTTSDLSTAASAWTSPGSNEQQRGDLGQTDTSADSTIESLSSSLAPFHANRVDELGRPRAKYPLPHEIRATDSEPDSDVTSASNTREPTDLLNTRPELNESLEPNPGSCNHSLEEASGSQSPAIHESNIRKSAQYKPSSQPSRVSARKPPPVPIPRRHGSLMELARDVFSRPSYGLATTASPFSPGQSLELESSTVSAESISDGILTDRRVTAEQRLSEYGFIKSLAGKPTFVINPSPGKFSRRTGSAELEFADSRKENVFDFSNSIQEGKERKDPVFESADSYIEQDMIESSTDPVKQGNVEPSQSFVTDLRTEKHAPHSKDNVTCKICDTIEIHSEDDWDIQECGSMDGNNNSLTKEPKPGPVAKDKDSSSKPSVQAMAYRFEHRNISK